MIIAATSDIHGPNFFNEFVDSLKQLSVKPDLFLLAGDIIERGMIDWYEKIHQALIEKVKCPIIACFGNNEFIPDNRIKMINMFRDVKFLDDEAIVLEVGSETVGIIGTIGSLDSPTRWQLEHIQNIRKIYENRVDMVERFLKRLSTDIKIVLMHYAPTYKTLEGENYSAFPGLGSFKYESVFIKNKPTLVIHGHSHKGIKFSKIDSVPVFNVAFPVNKEIVVINTNDLKRF